MRVEYPRVVLRKGQRGLSFNLIFSGSAFLNVEESLATTGHVWHTAITLQRGDGFGELALLRNTRRTASVVIREDAELLVVEKDVFSKTCPIIFDKELDDKIKFCKNLTLFDLWPDDALINLCIEAQIQQWKINKIIVKDSSQEFDWIYLCIQGKCSVVKVLDLQVPLKLARSRRMTKDEVYYPKGLVRKKNRFLADTSKIWIKELHKSLENSFSFGGTKMVDECYQECDNERCRDWDSESTSDDELLESETTLQTSNSPYEYQTLVKGKYDNTANENTNVIDEKGIRQEQAKMETTPTELEKRDQAESVDFSELLQTDSKTGKLNKDVVYLNIASMKRGDIFDVSQLVKPTGRKLMLVSKGAVMMKIKRDDFFRYSTKQTLKKTRRIVQELDYPTEEIICRSYNNRCAWERFKRRQLQSTMADIQEKCIRHNNDLCSKSLIEAKGPLTPARIDGGPSRHERFKEYMSFVYDSHKVQGS
ncbi:uncharacterized protein LOC141895065 [Acropora palmata]|uniref:uncharacterized protein LOC141895065 n=1 Tax=Acropora palmata TaxID=6131 RepID=UPI003DA1BDEB